MGFKRILEPITIGEVTLPNRIVFPAFQTNFATFDGFVTGRHHSLYEKISRGGCGLIITGCIAVSDDGLTNTNVLRITKAEHIAPLGELFRIIKQNGAVPGAQLIHAGRQTHPAITGHPLVAPSSIPCPVMRETPVELDLDGITRIQNDFADAAGRLKEAGVELIELHGAFGYLIGGFLSPYSNKRKDKYGIDRTLFFTEIIEKVRARVGDIPISCRISADEFVDGGLTLDLTRNIAQKLVEAGADVINVSAGTYASMDHMVPTRDMPPGTHVYLARAVRETAGAPVMCAGNIKDLELAEAIISGQESDLVCMGRSQIADPHFVNKSLKHQAITECNNCNICMYFLHGETSLSCPRNPEI